MVRRFQDPSGLVVARIRQMQSGEFRLAVFASDGALLSERLFPRERDAEDCLYRAWPSMREVA